MKDSTVNGAAPPRRKSRTHLWALGWLCGAVGGLVALHVTGWQGTAAGFVRAALEAALVGALADWFAVSALFRHPMGLPLPHTAIIPANKERLGQRLGIFVAERFLTEAQLAGLLHRNDVVARTAAWLADAKNKPRIETTVRRFAAEIVFMVDSSQIQTDVTKALGQWLKRMDGADLLSRLLAMLGKSEHLEPFLAFVSRRAGDYIRTHQDLIRRKVEEGFAREGVWGRLAGLFAQDKVSRGIIDGLLDFAASLDRPSSGMRQGFAAEIEALAQRIREDPKLREGVQSLQRSLGESPETQAMLGEIAAKTWAALLEDLRAADSAITNNLVRQLVAFATRILDDEDLRERVHTAVEHLFVAFVVENREVVAEHIANVVRNWDAKQAAQELEQEIGPDLQWIRINGTLIGGVIGLAIHAVDYLLR